MNIVNENTTIQGCKTICHSIGGSCGEKIKKFYFLPYRPPHGVHKILSGLFFFQLLFEFSIFFQCYLNRVEHEKCSEMCVWIVRFGLKLRKLDHF
jgi:hypothetical protein